MIEFPSKNPRTKEACSAKFLINKFHPDIIGIANPDVVFGNDLAEKIKELFAEKKEYAVLTGSGTRALLWGKNQRYISHRFVSVLLCLIPFSDFLKKIMQKLHAYSYYPEKTRNNPGIFHDVWAVEGCLFFIRTEDFVNVGMLDENVFLYGEEFILASKLQDAGRKTGITHEATFEHNHVYPAGRLDQLESSKKRNLLMNKSEVYFVEHYVTSNKFLIAAFRLLSKLRTVQIHVSCFVKKLMFKAGQYFSAPYES